LERIRAENGIDNAVRLIEEIFNYRCSDKLPFRLKL
jgi:hypothetical protein